MPTKTPTALLLAAASVVPVATAQAQDKPLRGAEVWSRDSVLYGRFEMRMKAVRASGTLATFFLFKNGAHLPGTPWEEIDIEIFGKDDALTWQSNIITGEPRQFDEAVHRSRTSYADEFHTFTIEWTPDAVTWFVNGQEIRRATGDNVRQLTSPQTMRFNIWASNIPSWTGPVETRRLPVYQHVDWFKYSRYENGEFIHEWTDNFDTFDDTRWQKADWTFGENIAQFTPENILVRDGMLILALTVTEDAGRFDAAD